MAQSNETLLKSLKHAREHLARQEEFRESLVSKIDALFEQQEIEEYGHSLYPTRKRPRPRPASPKEPEKIDPRLVAERELSRAQGTINQLTDAKPKLPFGSSYRTWKRLIREAEVELERCEYMMLEFTEPEAWKEVESVLREMKELEA